MTRNQKISIFITGSLLLSLGACVTQKYKTPEELKADGLYRDVAQTDTATIANLPTSTLFTDPQLQALIKEGIENNLDLKASIERMKSAEANLRLSKTAFLPSLNLDVNATDNKQSRAALNLPPSINIPLETQLYRAQLSTAWEIDVWGKLGSAKRSALASYLQTDAAKRAVQTQLVSSIATNYYTLLALDTQLKITEQTLASRIKNVEAIKELKEAGIVNGAAVVQSEANRYAAEVSIPDLRRSIRETENALNLLLGRGAGSVARSTFDVQQDYKDLQVGLSSQLLKNRPDVQQAELAFRVAFENTNLAKTYFYPQLTLTANGGLSSLKLENFFNNSIFYSIVGGLTQPIFNKGQNKARLTSAKAAQQESYFAFQKSVLTAGSEVSNALYAYQTAVEKEASRAKQIESLEKAVDYTKELLKYSSATNYTDVLTSEQSLLSAQLNGVNDRLQKLQAIVSLYRALGGGWKE
ncbi:efflux transporter outer membrane subunit [Pedobacter xixiisoli]|uniref:Efflux transporter, outer membrane factor (OMF) lipoprotein, NodT family n=1 Tax=Pedobacter xixiisoli TaxID=1476464 RepID=A0A286AEH7_9SPHI|nr:efflux transporter outer membrane subunit [Pedobacter xixiisoli]SOD20300.1 efflux transporter, outer membrane factor (OMF) lipoprotein, NodT family [Pedobacter xixiisoli]